MEHEVNKHDRTKGLLKGTLIYAVGNIGSKLLMVLMLPLYSFFLSKEDFGYYDLSMTILFLLASCVTFDMKDGVFRFLLDNNSEEHRRNVVSSSFYIIFRNSIVSIIVASILFFFFPIRCGGYLIATMVTFCIFDVEIQSLRGIGRTLTFVYVNLICAFLTCLLCYLLAKYGGLKLEAFYISLIASRIFAVVFIEWRERFFLRYFSLKWVTRKTIFSLLKYTLPLIPTVACWWLMSSSCRLFVNHYLGLSANGILGMSIRFSEMLYMASVIFYQSWQETAIKEYKSSDRDNYFSIIFNKYFGVLTALTLSGAFLIKAFFPQLMGNGYQESTLYIYLMMVGVVFTAMSFFLDLGYQCSFQSHRSLPSIVLATGINLLLNFLLVPKFQLYGVAFSSIVTYLFLFVYRMFDTRRYFHIKIQKSFYLYLIILVGCGFLYNFIDDKNILVAIGLLGVVLLYFVSGRELIAKFLRK